MSLLPVTTFENAVVNLRSKIIQYTGLRPEFVLNGDSLYGPDLLNMMNSSVGESPNIRDGFIVFEFHEIDNENTGVTPDGEFTMSSLSAYGLFLKIYGDTCHRLAQKLLTIFKYPNVITSLRESGLHVINTLRIGSLNEFINQVRWPRCDIEIDVLCRLQFEFEPDPDFDTVAETIARPIHIIKV